ncbi:lethal giant larvae like, C-terminal-domain-containing protein [Microdochium bolleyi]|uniref:Lethal giant larvae like, C-terminal-domain-containing protein n=1 Tax=Microdochium bolleyi TaxID=196109 RepID=A0A136IWS1_9PEZI|nr:lethal giant larvae like, C-terminal-domain-containing protein [Microdochium bolleyi]
MSAFLRGKQTGMHNDLSANIRPELFAPDDRSRYGINSQISCLRYEPVQSLLAVGTNESKFGSGRIYVFGQSRVQKLLVPNQPCSFVDVQFCANRLISLDSKHEVTIWNLDTGERVNYFRAPGVAVCILTDPMLDWCFIGMQHGDVFAYDLDRERMSNFRLPNFWSKKDSRARAITLVSLQMHPRDIGKLLIAYSHGVAIYSFKQNQPTMYLEYEVPPGAPGGNGTGVDLLRKPRITHAAWHPTGTFILTAHTDGSLVFWDTKDGRVVMARNLDDFGVDQPSPKHVMPKQRQPFIRIAWCCKSNPEDSGLLIAGGRSMEEPANGLTFIELGVTPVYATSSWQVLGDYCKGKKQSLLETPPGAEIADFFLAPRVSPHFSNACDPIAVLTLLSSGELLTLSFPSGYPISPTNQLHPSLSFVHPFATKFEVSVLERPRWLGMVENRNRGESLLKGGAEAPLPSRKFEGRTIIQVAHADSTVRIWDVGHGDEIENSSQLQVDVARSLDRYEDITVTALSMGAQTGELAVGTTGGEVLIYKWGANKFFGTERLPHIDPNPGGLTDISARAEPGLKTGLQPAVMYEMMQGPISVLKVSDIGFVAVGSEGGFISIIDLRQPAVIFQASMAEYVKSSKRASFLKGSTPTAAGRDFPVKVEFGIMTLEEDNYSSICCFVGTTEGKVITLKLLPSGNSYSVQAVGVSQFNDRVVALCPIVAATGKPAYATGSAVAGLREGRGVEGLLVVVTRSEARIFRPASGKGASKSFDDYLCDAASVTEFQLHGMALVGVFGDRMTRAFSLPGLKEIGSARLPMMDGSRCEEAIVTNDGDVFVWAGPSELAILDVWGIGKQLGNTADTLINPALVLPPRPTISNVQWISGTQYVSPPDLDLLIGGPDRPPSKRMLEAEAAMQRGGSQGYGAAAGTSQEGWGDYLTRQLNERTEKLNIMNDSVEGAANASQNWSDEAGKFFKKQKRNLLWGSVTSKFS